MIPWVFVILLSIGMTIHIALGLYSRRFKGQSVQLPFEILMYICAIWCATFIFDISTDSLALKIILMQVRYIGVSFITLTLLVIAIFFTGHGSWLTKRRLALLLVIPVINVVLALATQYSTLFRYNYTLVETAGGFSVLGFTNGIWSSAVYLPFNYIMEVATFILLLQVIFGGQKLYARQALLFFAAIVIPVIFDVMFTLGISPVQGYNMTPSTFAFTGIILAIALFEFRFIDIVPIARTMLFEQMTDPMLVLDPEGRLADFNPAAEQVLGVNRMKDIGKASSIPLKKYEALLECIGQQHHAPCTITIGSGVEARLFEVSIQEMRSGGGMPPAKLVIMRDVTDRTRAEERAVHLASFPELTPVLILEADPDGSILYANPSCVSSLQEMGETDPRMFIPQDLRDRLDGTVIAESLHEVREIELHGRLFRENVYFTPQFSSIRIYATDITDRDKTEAALRESEEKYREFFTTSRDSVFITTPEGQWVDFNDTALEMFGYGSREELMALPLPDLYLHPGQRGDLLTRIEREGYVKEFAVQLIKKDGSVIDTLITAVPLQNPDGSIKAFVGSIRDITDQKRAEDALRESERKFRETVKTLDEGYYSCTLDGMLLEHNVAFNRILGIDADLDLKGTQLPDFWQNPDDRTPYVEELLAKGFIQNFSINAKTVQGTNIVVLANSHLVKDENDRIVRIDGTFTDFTERKRAEEGLRESEEKFATAFKTSPYAITITRATDGSFIDVNDAFTQITGYTHEETVINSSIGLDLWVNMEDRKRVLFDLIGGRNVVGREFLFRRKDGVIMTGLFSAQIILLNNEPCILSSISDITERKDAEERLRQSAIRFRSLIQNSSDMIRIIDQNGRIVYGSDSTRRILGYTPESLLGTDPLDFIHPDDLGKVRADLKQVCDRINPGTPTEFRIRKADGEYIWVDSVGINLLDEPSVNGIVVTTRPIQQRKLAEDALRESETRFRTMADWTYDWEYWIDHQKNVVYMSPSVERVTGYPAKDFSADRDLIDRIVHPDDRAAWDSHVSLHTQHETADDPVEIEFRILTREGKIRWISHTCRTICSDTTTCIGRRVSNRDITDRKRAEEELRETNEYLNNLFNYANAPIITWDPEFQITRFNHAFEHLAGRLQEEVLGEKLDILFPAVSKEASLSLITKALEGERWETVEIPILNADGSTRSVLWNSANVLGRDGNVIATIAQGVDITDQKQALDRIRWLASFPELNPNPVIEMDANGTITFANAVASTTLYDLGLPDDPALFIPGDKDEILRLLREMDEPQLYREISIGNEIFAENISLNRVLQVVRIYTLNVTGQKRAEREREHMLADLEQKNAELERFAYTASHDLKTPLITIRGFLGFVERDAETGDMVRLRKDLARIGNAAAKMQDLLDSLLELSKIGRIVGPPERVSMQELSYEATELLAVPINERNISLSIAENLPEVYGDKKRLLEVMTNLIENGVKFMGDQKEPRIEIGMKEIPDKTVFFVRDNGIGIPPDYQGRLFSLFERIEVNVPGTGLGLALVKRIIEFHGGKIWVESEGKGKGTTFWFTLPGVPEDRDDNHAEQK